MSGRVGSEAINEMGVLKDFSIRGLGQGFRSSILGTCHLGTVYGVSWSQSAKDLEVGGGRKPLYLLLFCNFTALSYWTPRPPCPLCFFFILDLFLPHGLNQPDSTPPPLTKGAAGIQEQLQVLPIGRAYLRQHADTDSTRLEFEQRMGILPISAKSVETGIQGQDRPMVSIASTWRAYQTA